MGRYRGAGPAALLALTLAVTRPVRAEAPAAVEAPAAAPALKEREPLDAHLEVERGPDAQACPDADAVFRSIARLFPERRFRPAAAATSVASASVVIRALAAGYEAVLRVSAPHRGERVILEKDADCRGLADALALAFVLLVDPPEAAPAGIAPRSEGLVVPAPPVTDKATAPSPSLAQAPAPPSPPADSASGRGQAPARERRFTGSVTAGALGGAGILSQPALGAAAGVEVVHASGFGLSLEGLRLWSPSASAEGGSVTLTLWGLLVGPCYQAQVGRTGRVEACVRVGTGSQYAKVDGFIKPASGAFPWTVLSPTLGYRTAFAKVLSGFARVGPLGQLRPQSFSARVDDGSGSIVPVAKAPHVGVMAELGVSSGGAVF